MRISDWSSDVCSSDLVGFGDGQLVAFVFAHEREVLGQHGEPRAAAGRLAQQLRGGFEVGDHIIATAHLDRSHRRVHFLRSSVLSAECESNLSNCGLSQPPYTAYVSCCNASIGYSRTYFATRHTTPNDGP